MSDNPWEAPQKQDGAGAPDRDETWAKDLIGRVAFVALLEQRRARRWGIFFKSLIFLYLLALLVLAMPGDWETRAIGKQHTARVDLHGVIAEGTEASAENVIVGLRAAFDDPRTAGVIIAINSPGGSPVQAGEIYDEIQKLRREHMAIPVYAVVADVGASGGYYVAAAAQAIYANQASIVGSIGVRTDSFGFVEALDKLGIERRLYTAGEHKGFLDPFSPPRSEDIAHLKTLLEAIHGQFIAAVREGRGERLKETPELFSGLVWTGQQSVELGLVDGLASARYVAEELIGSRKIVNYTHRPQVLDRFLGGVETAVQRAVGRVLGLDPPLR